MTRIFTVFLSYLLFSLNAFAQESTGIIVGTVNTNEGRAATDVSVQIKGTTKGAITNEKGVFELRRVQPGNVILQISLLGFETTEQEITVEAGKTSRTSIQLKAGAKELNQVVNPEEICGSL